MSQRNPLDAATFQTVYSPFPDPAPADPAILYITGTPRILLQSVHFQLATSVAVANRMIRIGITNQDAISHFYDVPYAQTASLTIIYGLYNGSMFTAPPTPVSSNLIYSLPLDRYFDRVTSIQISIGFVAAADLISNAFVHYRKWLDTPSI